MRALLLIISVGLAGNNSSADNARPGAAAAGSAAASQSCPTCVAPGLEAQPHLCCQRHAVVHLVPELAQKHGLGHLRVEQVVGSEGFRGVWPRITDNGTTDR